VPRPQLRGGGRNARCDRDRVAREHDYVHHQRRQYLAAEVLAHYLPRRLEERESVIWIEEYPLRQPIDEGDRSSPMTFSSYTPRVKWCGDMRSIALEEPSWQHIAETEMVVLIGDGAGRSDRTQDQEERDPDRASCPSRPCMAFVCCPVGGEFVGWIVPRVFTHGSSIYER
jgi:hypothetical protein